MFGKHQTNVNPDFIVQEIGESNLRTGGYAFLLGLTLAGTRERLKQFPDSNELRELNIFLMDISNSQKRLIEG